MNDSPASRTLLTVFATALIVSAVWILSDRSVQSNESIEPVWRYTNHGWQELSELTPPSPAAQAGPFELVSPLVWAALQLLIALVILISFNDEAPRLERGPLVSGKPSERSPLS
jgi:hypothetical protein